MTCFNFRRHVWKLRNSVNLMVVTFVYDGHNCKRKKFNSQQKQQNSGRRFEMTHFPSKLSYIILAYVISFIGGYDLEVGGITGVHTGPYASKMTWPTRSGLHGKCQISPFWGSTYSNNNSKYAKKWKYEGSLEPIYDYFIWYRSSCINLAPTIM